MISSLYQFSLALNMWPEFSTARGIFCAIAWTATALAVVMFVISMFSDITGGGVDAGGADIDTSAGDAGVFSIQAVIGFMLGFGWIGFMGICMGWSVAWSLVAGLVAGVVMFVIVGAIIRFIYSLKSDGTIDYSTLVGKEGTVYVTIPPHGEPGGQVQVAHPNQLLTMPAVQEGDEPLPAQTRIVVTAATPLQLTVRRLS